MGSVTVSISDTIACYCLTAVLVLTMVSSVRRHGGHEFPLPEYSVARGKELLERPCEEIYMVREGETLQTIGEKCGDPFIVERNPHIHDPDDVFPGLVIRIAPSSSSPSFNVPVRKLLT